VSSGTSTGIVDRPSREAARPSLRHQLPLPDPGGTDLGARHRAV